MRLAGVSTVSRVRARRLAVRRSRRGRCRRSSEKGDDDAEEEEVRMMDRTKQQPTHKREPSCLPSPPPNTHIHDAPVGAPHVPATKMAVRLNHLGTPLFR